jgi:hypothetical protein
MEFDEEKEEQKLSKINSAGLINLILKNLWDKFYDNLIKKKYDVANAALDCLWVEIAGDLEEESEETKKFKSIDEEVSNNYSKIPKHYNSFRKLNNSESVLLSKQYRLLNKKAIFIKRMQNKQGKGTAYHDSSEDYMDV